MGGGYRSAEVLPLLAIALAFNIAETGSSYVSNGMFGVSGQNVLPATALPLPLKPEPYIDQMTPKNVTALVGKSAYLSCKVRNLANKTVSWIRHRDIHILTVGGYTYTSDQRFAATHHRDNDEWTLQIKFAQKRDAGVYECQISTQPVKSYFVYLNVVGRLPPPTSAPVVPTCIPVLLPEPEPDDSSDIYHQMVQDRENFPPVPTATILGGPDLHVDKGSTINLTCTIRYSPEPPAFIFWYHHEEVISYDSSRGGVSVITEKGEVTTSYLLIQNAELSDSGKYSCSPSNADVASVRVHVLNGERPAAMQTGSAGLSNSSLNILALLSLVFLYSLTLGR